MDNLISVIIPIYNVEKYLTRCVDSIINQTYRNIEIILVDDESPDKCPEICDRYLNKDNRIKVIHKKNGGLSDARNKGMDIAKGDYIAFVDSDDYIALDMYENLISLIEKYNADISSCSVYKFYEDEDINLNCNQEYNVKVYSNEQALKSLIEEKEIKQTVWNKIYKKSVIKDIKFEVGKIHEDEYWTYQIIGNANKIVHINKPMYYYLQRKDSIMGQEYSAKRLNVIYSRKERLDYIANKFPNLLVEAKMSLFFTCIYNYQFLLRDKKINNKLDLLETIKYYAENIEFNKNDRRFLTLKQQVWFFMARKSLNICCKLRNYLNIGL